MTPTLNGSKPIVLDGLFDDVRNVVDSAPELPPQPPPDRGVGLAIGLGWQLAIIYLAVTSPDRREPGETRTTTSVALPPISLLTRTVASRARSLGLDESGPGAGWARAMEALVAGSSLDADDTSRLASELHLGLVESLSSADIRLRPAYELGRLLSETVVIATGAPPERCASLYRQLFDPLRLLPLADWLALLEAALPNGAGYAVFSSLQRWSRWVVSANDPKLLRSAPALREQGRLWRDLLLDRTSSVSQQIPSDAASSPGSGSIETPGSPTDPIAVAPRKRPGPTISQSLADISMTAAYNLRRSGAVWGDDGSVPASLLALADAATRLPTALDEGTALGTAPLMGDDLPLAVEGTPETEPSSTLSAREAGAGAVAPGLVPSLLPVIFRGPDDLESSVADGAVADGAVADEAVADEAPPVTADHFVSATAPRRLRRSKARVEAATRSTRSRLAILGVVAAAAGCVLVLRTYVATPLAVPTASMAPTLQPGDRMLVDRIAGAVHRGDIVVFHAVAGEPGVTVGADVVTRVIGLPGDHLRSIGDHVYVNGAPLAEPWLPALTGSCSERSLGIKPQVVPPNRYFVVGDCRGISLDSRSFGTIAATSVVGKVFAVVWHHGHPWLHWF